MLRSHIKHDDSPVRILLHEGILGVGRIRGDEDGGVRNRRENRAQHKLLDVAIVQKVARLLEVRLPISLADVKAHDRPAADHFKTLVDSDLNFPVDHELPPHDRRHQLKPDRGIIIGTERLVLDQTQCHGLVVVLLILHHPGKESTSDLDL